MGESIGVSEQHACARTKDLQSVSRWYDEIFATHFEEPVPLISPAVAPVAFLVVGSAG